MDDSGSVTTTPVRSPGDSGELMPIEVPAVSSDPIAANASRPDTVDLVSAARITQLDGWRGISILFVIIGHLLNFKYSSAGPGEHAFPIAGVLANWGVELFFVISGFIITKLALSERDLSGNFSARAFYVRRFFRIIPPFFLYLAFILLAADAGLISQGQSETLRAATFTCNLPGTDCGWFGGHTWTLAYEEQFYLIFPPLFAMSGRSAKHVFVALYALLVSFPFLRHLLHLGGMAYLIAPLLQNFLFICAGSVMAAYEPLLKRMAGGQNAVYLTILAAVCTLALLLLQSTPAAPASPAAYLQASLSITILPVCFAWLIGASLYTKTRLTSVLNAKALQFVGLISYSLYLWQQLFTANSSLYLTNSWFFFPPAMFFFAAASYYLVERPCVRFAKRWAANEREG